MRSAHGVMIATALLVCFALSHAATWKVFVYIEARDGLADMAIKNLTDMMRGSRIMPNNDKVQWLVQLHAYDNTALRYILSKHTLTYIEQIQLSGDSKKDCINALSWAFADTHVDHTMLIFSNHGWGILDPMWNAQTQEWQADNDGLSNTCTIKRSSANLRIQHAQHKGFMFSVEPRTYLSNEDLIACLHVAQEHLLGGKKIDIVAFDTCMGNMLEIGYQLAPYASILIGSQSCSLRDGFDYSKILLSVCEGRPPLKTANDMVYIFNEYYSAHDASGTYTHAALYLENAHAVREALDAAIAACMQLPHARSLLCNARNASPRFCLWPMYSDLVAFWQAVDEQLPSENCSPEILSCKAAIQEFYTAIKRYVIKHCAGAASHDKAHGIGIYLPTHSVYPSYRTTPFARDSRWVELLDAMHETTEIVGDRATC